MKPDAGLNPIADNDWPEIVNDLRSGFAGGLNVYRTMAHHPALLRAWQNLREHIVNNNVLGRQRAEVVILRAGHRLESSYEWSQHILRARKYGLTDRRIASLCGPVSAMAHDDAILAQAVDQLFDQSGLTEGCRVRLQRLVGPQGVLDLMATVGFYCTLGFILNTFGTPLDDDAKAELAASPLSSETY